LAVSLLCRLPPIEEQSNFLHAADQWARPSRMSGSEAACDRGFAQHAPDLHRVGESLEGMFAKALVLKLPAEQVASARADEDGVGFCQDLKPRREVRRLSYD